MTVIKDPIRGTWNLSDIKFGRLIRMSYYGYTKREATQLFREYLKLLKE